MDRFQERTTYEEMENEVTADELVEQNAEELAIFGPRCATRDALICQAQTINQMRLALRAHECECVHCACTRKTVVSDRLMLRPDAVCCERLVA
jgi:hypothetical protein